MTSVEAKLNQLLDENAALTRIITQLKQALRQARLLMKQTELEERIQNLPMESRERLRKAFPDTDLNGLRQAIHVEEKRQ